jgi:hypothetical protein
LLIDAALNNVSAVTGALEVAFVTPKLRLHAGRPFARSAMAIPGTRADSINAGTWFSRSAISVAADGLWSGPAVGCGDGEHAACENTLNPRAARPLSTRKRRLSLCFDISPGS